MLEIDALATDMIGPISVRLAPGECMAVTGPSGAGKSLFLRAIADLDPNRGRVNLNGSARDAMPAPDWRKRVALVPAESGWWEDRVGAHFDPAFDPAPMLEAVGLEKALDWSVARLSTGEKQRLALVRALCRRPEALLLDEPTAALDAGATGRVEGLIRAALERGAPVILVTHDPAQADRLGARRYRMEAGQLIPVAA